MHQGEAIGRWLVEEGVEDARFSAGLDETSGAEIAGLVRRGLLGNQVFAAFIAGVIVNPTRAIRKQRTEE